jgi:hypothetical protein
MTGICIGYYCSSGLRLFCADKPMKIVLGIGKCLRQSMSVEQVDIIDFIAHDPKTNSVRLIMVESRDWGRFQEAVQQLDAKLRPFR